MMSTPEYDITNSLCHEALKYAEEVANMVNMAKRGIGQVAPLAVMPIAA
jgi:hypothetical protein